MSNSQSPQSQSTLSIPCIINRASLGEADYVFAVINELLNLPSKVVWVPRKDLIIEEQPLTGGKLKARLRVKIEREVADTYDVIIVNEGEEETVKVAKGVVLASS